MNSELDELRRLSSHGKEYLLELQRRESERTGIPSLKVSYNNVFGYYIEVRSTHNDKVPEDWTRKQTLANAERYIFPELKEYEEKILGAEERIASLEDVSIASFLYASRASSVHCSRMPVSSPSWTVSVRSPK